VVDVLGTRAGAPGTRCLVASFLLASLGFAPGLAPRAQAQGSAPSADAKITLKDDPGTPQGKKEARLELEGRAPGLPDGTKVHVTLLAGESEAAFFMTLVSDGAFRATKRFSGRTLAPLRYRVRVELILADQRQAIGRLLRLEWGLPKGARVLLVDKRIEIGTPDEQAQFRLATIGRLLKFVRLGRVCVGETTQVLKTPVPEDKASWRVIQQELAGKVRAIFLVPFDAYRRTYVAIPEPAALSEIQACMSKLGPALSRHRRGQTDKGQALLDQVTAGLARVEKRLLRSKDLTPRASAARPATRNPAKPAALAAASTAPTGSGAPLASAAQTGSSAAPPPSRPEDWGLSPPRVEEASAGPLDSWPVAIGLFGFLGLVGLALLFVRRRS
jgi:MYXO-CTERM domain-containing protein